MDGKHGFGFGVSGHQLRTLIAARQLCSGCVGTGRQWCLHTRSSVACSLCAGGTLAAHASLVLAPVATFAPPTPLTIAATIALAAD